MFKRKSNDQAPAESAERPGQRKLNWLAISLVLNGLLFVALAGIASASTIIHQSDTDPNFCSTCHIMRANVDSYLNSNHLDHVHAEAGVMCKECHSDYGIPEEVRSAVNFLTGNYLINADGSFPKRDFDDAICTQCHGDMMSVAQSTDYLFYNPHNSGMGTFTCDTCHLSHGPQIDYCSGCHTHGGQRMIEDSTPREAQIDTPETNRYGP